MPTNPSRDTHEHPARGQASRAAVRPMAGWGLIAGFALLVALVALVAIGRWLKSEPSHAPGGAGPAASSDPSTSEAAETTRHDEATDAMVVRYDAGRVTVAALETARAGLLKRLAVTVGFQLTMHAPLPGTITLHLTDVAIEEVLRRVLEGVAFGVEYSFDPGATVHRVHHVRVGFAPLAQSATVTGASTTDPATASPRRPDWLPQPDSSPMQAQQERLARLESNDPGERLDAVAQLPPVGSAVERLRELALHDPERSVRAAAVRQLGGGDDYAATRTLIEALGDPDPEVVVQALGSLADLGDISVLAEARRAVGGSEDPNVRMALEATATRLTDTARVDPERPEIVVGRTREEREADRTRTPVETGANDEGASAPP